MPFPFSNTLMIALDLINVVLGIFGHGESFTEDKLRLFNNIVFKLFFLDELINWL